MILTRSWDKFIYSKLKIDFSLLYQPIEINDENYKEMINELLSFINTFKKAKFIHKNLIIDNILYNKEYKKFTILNLDDSKIKKDNLNEFEQNFDMFSLYFSFYQKYTTRGIKDNNKILYFQTVLLKYIPLNDLCDFHLLTNNSFNTIIDCYS